MSTPPQQALLDVLRQIAPDPDHGLPQGAKKRLVGVAKLVHLKLRSEARKLRG